MKTKQIAPKQIARKSRSRISVKRIAKALAGVLACAAVATALAWWGRQALFLNERAQAGDVEAQYLLGRRCFKLASSRDEWLNGVEWLGKAAKAGHAKAQTSVGIIYARGMGVPQSPELALVWLTRAAMQGEALAQNELATLYVKGNGVPRNLQKAIHWYREAATAGSLAAKRNLCLAMASETKTLGDIVTRSGKRYAKASLRKIDADGITVTFKLDKGGVGFAKVKAVELPQNLAGLCSQNSTQGNESSGFKWSRLDLVTAQM